MARQAEEQRLALEKEALERKKQKLQQEERAVRCSPPVWGAGFLEEGEVRRGRGFWLGGANGGQLFCWGTMVVSFFFGENGGQLFVGGQW